MVPYTEVESWTAFMSGDYYQYGIKVLFHNCETFRVIGVKMRRREGKIID